MPISIAVQMTSQGLLIPRAALRDWDEVEVIEEQQRIIIRPKPTPGTEHERVLRILKASGLLVKHESAPTSPPVSPAEFTELAEKFSVGRPLSEAIIEEREERW